LPDIAGLNILSATPAADFTASRAFEIHVLPLDAAGNPIMETNLGLSAQAANDGSTSPVELVLGTPVLVAASASILPYAVVIDLDSSGSMSTTDPNRSRVAAAKTMVETLLAYRPSSLITVADFGSNPTAPFGSTRVLSGWSSDRAVLDAAIDRVTASGGTPLYESVDELLAFLDPAMPASDYQRMVFVLSDGAPTTTTLKPTVYADAVRFGIPVHAVSLGEGSVTATMADLAANTGGIHAASSDAASLMTSFKSLVVAREKGYVKVSGSFPAAAVPGTRALIEITIKSGAASKSGTVSLVL
jgi:Ca-activated chloride channel family protein